jgi:hypothetical protein
MHAMEAIYWVLTWTCRRKCRHCYDDRFRPYVREDLSRIVNEGKKACRAIIDNLPDDFTFRTRSGACKRGLLVLAGGELLIDRVRETLFYPVLDALRERYGHAALHISVQTTGDVMTPQHVEDMLARGVGTIAIASIDDHHVGFEGDKKFAFMDRVRAMMAPFGVKEIALGGARDAKLKAPDPAARKGEGPFFLFLAPSPNCGSVSDGRADAPGPMGFPTPRMKPISAHGGAAAKTF